MLKKYIFLFGLIAFVTNNLIGSLVFGDKDSMLEISPTGTLWLLTTNQMSKITGTIKTSSPQNIIYSGAGTGKLFFDAGVLMGSVTDDLFEINLTGTYDTTSTYSLILDGAGNTFNMVTPGAISERLKTLGTGSMIMGYPVFTNPNAILLTSDLTIAAAGELGTNIDINGGILTLGADLSLKDDVRITNLGTIDFQGYNLFTGQKDLLWTDTQTMLDAKNIQLGGSSVIRGQWKFKNDAHIVGNNYILDLTNGGSLFIKPNTTLRMSNLTLKGLGTGSIIFERPTSKLELFNVIVDMDKSVTMTLGNVYITGDSTVVTRNKLLTFDQTSSLSVDRSTLFYNTLNYKDVNNIQFTNLNSNFASLNGGSVRKVRSLQVGDYLINTDVILDRTFVVSPLKRLEFQDNATVDGDGFAYMFARQPGGMIASIAASKRAKFTNILLKDFPIDDVVALSRGANSQLIFGDNTQVELGDSGTLTTTWYVDGNVVINGNGKQLELANTAEIVLRPGASLLLDNMTIRGVSVNQIRCMDHLGTVSWGNVTCKMDGDFTYTQGMMTLLGQLDLVGTATFGYASSKPFEITRFGNLFVDKDAAFKYMPPTENRDLIVMDDVDAQIHLNGGNLISTTTGMRLTVGTLYVDAHSYVQNKDAVGEQESVSFGDGTPADDLTIRLGSSATLDVISGRVIYDNQE